MILFIPKVCVLLWTGTANLTFKFIASSVIIDWIVILVKLLKWLLSRLNILDAFRNSNATGLPSLSNKLYLSWVGA